MICNTCYQPTGHRRKPFCSERCAAQSAERLEAIKREREPDDLDTEEELQRAQRLWQEWRNPDEPTSEKE